MKRKLSILTFILVCTLIKNDVQAQAASVVKDRYVSRQAENMVFIRWGGFRPKWYYILFHNKYRKGPDRRTILQLVPTGTVIWQSKEKSEDEGDEVVKMYAMEYWDATNRSLELHYHFHFKKIFDELNGDIDLLKSQAVQLGADPSAITAFAKEQERLNGEIEIIRKGYLEKGDSAEAMEAIEKDLRALKGNLIKFNHLQSVNQKYLNPQP